MNKKCSKCRNVKMFAEFYTRSCGSPTSECKVCSKERVAKYAKTDKGRYVRAIAEAKHRKKEWKISKEDYLQLTNMSCFYCAGVLDDNSFGIGLDRIDNSKGYLISNVVRSCSFCNYLRGDLLTLEETKELINLLVSIRQRNISGEN